MILGLDMAIHTGWCLIDDDAKVVDYGLWDYSEARKAVGRHNGHLFNAFRDDLEPHYRVDQICFERSHHRGQAATKIGVGMATVALMFAAKHGMRASDVATMTLKKWATGSGKSGKDQMMRRASEWAGTKIEQDDIGDAICVGMWCYDQKVKRIRPF